MYVILLFSGVVGFICGAKKREKQSANPIRIPTRFCDDCGIILEVILAAKIVQKSMWNLSVFLEGPWAGLWEIPTHQLYTVGGKGGPGERLDRGKTPIQRDVVCRIEKGWL